MVRKGFWGARKPEVMSQTLLEYLGNDSENTVLGKKEDSVFFKN